MNSELLFDIIDFTKDFSGEESIYYGENTNIETDVGITGDDAVDYIVAFGEKYNVDISNFDFHNHFDVEGAYFAMFFVKSINKIPITIGSLVDAIALGKLI